MFKLDTNLNVLSILFFEVGCKFGVIKRTQVINIYLLKIILIIHFKDE